METQYFALLSFGFLVFLQLLSNAESGVALYDDYSYTGYSIHLMPNFMGCLDLTDDWKNRTSSLVTDVCIIMYVQKWCTYYDNGGEPYIWIKPGKYPRLDQIMVTDPAVGRVITIDKRISSMSDCRRRSDGQIFNQATRTLELEGVGDVYEDSDK